MKRKLISYDVFESIQADSLSTAEHELLEAEPILARALELEGLNLVCFGAENVLYEAWDGTYVHANFDVDNKFVDFQNIEQLVIDESTEEEHSKSLINDMLEAVWDNNDAKANKLFDDFINQPQFTRDLQEGVQVKASASTGHGRKSPFRGRMRPGGHAAAMKAARTRKKHARLISPSMKSRLKRMRDLASHKLGGRSQRTGKGQRAVRTYLRFTTSGDKSKKMREWSNLVENVSNFIDYKEYGPVLRESVLAQDDKGNVTAVRVPTVQARNEAKMLTFNWKTLDTDVKILRGGAKNLSENVEFCKAVATLKRQNALSDNDKLQESLEDIISRWPTVLYLTQNELSGSIATALESVNAKNYDDQTCDFMAEALLRTAHDTYTDRVAKVVSLTGNKEDANTFEAFRDLTTEFYPHLDENASLEMQIFVDLYEALRTAYGLSTDESLKKETANHLNELGAIIDQQVEPSLEVAVAATSWLNDLIETNLDSEEWNVSNGVHITVNGDNPQMAVNAKKGYTPASDFSGDWGDTAPVSDGNSYRNGLADEMRNRSYGNITGDGIYPSLDNPYVPKPFGKYEIKGEKTIDSDSDLLGHAGGSDTWPSLQNPYNPKAETPDSYKMNHGKEKDLVVDR